MLMHAASIVVTHRNSREICLGKLSKVKQPFVEDWDSNVDAAREFGCSVEFPHQVDEV